MRSIKDDDATEEEEEVTQNSFIARFRCEFRPSLPIPRLLLPLDRNGIGCSLLVEPRRTCPSSRPSPPSWLVVFAPWFLLPLLLQNRWFRSQENLWELPAEVVAPFSLSYIPDNIGHALLYFFNFEAEYPNSWLLSIAGFISLLYLFVKGAKRFRNWLSLRPRDYDVLALWGLALLGHLALIMAYHIGKLDSHFATRLGMPVHLILILAPIWLLISEKLPQRVWNISFVLAIGFYITVAAPHSSQAIFTKKNFAEREFRWAFKQLSTQEDRHYLVIDPRVTHWVVMQRQAIYTGAAKLNTDRILAELKTGIYREVFVIQRVFFDPVSGESQVTEADIIPEFKLELIDQYSSQPFKGIRLSKVVLAD